MKLKIITLALLTFFATNVSAEEIKTPEEKIKIPAEKAVIQFKTKLGVVTFVHQKHADLSITQCTTCHHTLQTPDSIVKPCHECHLPKRAKKAKKGEAPKAMKALHTRCTGCHEYTTAAGQHAGPLKKKCKLCHIKTSKKKK